MNFASKVKLLVPVLYAVCVAVYFALSWPDSPKFYHFIGMVLAMVSFGFWVTARVQLGNAFSIGAKASQLVSNGLYSKLRHPVYYFSILAVTGIGIYAWTTWAIIPIALLVLLEIYRIKQEEIVLLKKFGTAYKAYKTKTWF